MSAKMINKTEKLTALLGNIALKFPSDNAHDDPNIHTLQTSASSHITPLSPQTPDTEDSLIVKATTVTANNNILKDVERLTQLIPSQDSNDKSRHVLEQRNSAAASIFSALSEAKVPFTFPGKADYNRYAQTYNRRLQYRPGVIVLPTTVKHVQDAVAVASLYSVAVQAKSGGHSYASYSTGGQDGIMMIILEQFQAINLNTETNVVEVGGGVRLGNLASRIYNDGRRALSHGTCPGVGIGGHLTHGGFGLASRAWGLAMDALVAMDVVLANGTSVRCSPTQQPELFWGMRGAGESFGIVTSFHLRTQPAPERVVNFNLPIPGNTPELAARQFKAFQKFALNHKAVDRKLGMHLYMDSGGMSVGGLYIGPKSEFISKIQTPLLAAFEGRNTINATELSWIESVRDFANGDTLETPVTGYSLTGNFFAKSLTIPGRVPDDAVEAYTGFLRYEDATDNAPINWFLLFSLYGGRDSQIPTFKGDAAGSMGSRGATWLVQHYGDAGDATFPTEGIDFINEMNNVLPQYMPDVNFGAYPGYVDPSLSRAEAELEYYGSTAVQRLRALKRNVDPRNVFRNPQTITT